MKQCPQCKRTYADETITFCLVDGSILSAPYDQVPPTLVIPPPTIPSPRSTAPHVAETAPASQSPAPAGPRSDRSKSIYVVIALAVLLAGGIGVFFMLTARQSKSVQTSANTSPTPTGPAEQTQSKVNSQSGVDSPKQPSPSAASARPSPNRSQEPAKPKSDSENRPATIQADPALFPPDPRSLPYGRPASGKGKGPPANKGEGPTDYNKVFDPSEVTQKVRILSKPQPVYTEEARKNQIVGTVVLRAVFTPSGQVTNIQAIKGLPFGLTESAIAAAQQIKFTPAIKDGHAVSQYLQLEYNFNLY